MKVGRGRFMPVRLTCMRYIVLNPVRAGLTSDPAFVRWASYRCNALGEPDALVSPHPCYLALGTAPAARREAYTELCHNELSPDLIRDLRHAVGRRSARGSARAGTEFQFAQPSSCPQLGQSGFELPPR